MDDLESQTKPKITKEQLVRVKNYVEGRILSMDDDVAEFHSHFPIIMGSTILCLLIMGRPFACAQEGIFLWNGNDAHMSQHLFDPYSITHMLHGLLIRTTMPDPKNSAEIYSTVVFACAWEIIENTPQVIEMYREEAIHAGYYGDSVINSVGDILCCYVGWHISRYIGKYYSILTFLFLESALLVCVGDNLTKNVIQLTGITVSPIVLVVGAWMLKQSIECAFCMLFMWSVEKKFKQQ